jgi:hypothetical protein
VFPATVVAQVKAMACEPPEDRRVPQSRWSSAGLAAQARAEGLVEPVARSTVWRWLEEDAIGPWRYRSWIFPRDPDFAVAGRVLDLYQRIWEGAELEDDEFVLSTDEKSQLQILSRCHPGLPPGPRRPGRYEFERHGTVAYMAAYDVHRAHLMGRAEPATGNRAVHRPGGPGDEPRAVRLGPPGCPGSRTTDPPTPGRPQSTAWPRPERMRSWCTCRCTRPGSTRSEIVFSVIQRKVITPADFSDGDALAARLLAFQDRYNATAAPFDWKFTRAKLNDLCKRIGARRAASAPLAA